MFDAIEKELGSVDVVHNNAGVGGALVPDLEAWDSEHNMDHLEHWKQVLNINLVSQYIVATTAARVMVREGHGGSIINTASLTGHIVNQAPLGHTQDDSSYGVSKAGVLYFTKHFASQVIQYGSRVNSVSPGYCYSPGLHAGMSQEMLPEYPAHYAHGPGGGAPGSGALPGQRCVYLHRRTGHPDRRGTCQLVIGRRTFYGNI